MSILILVLILFPFLMAAVTAVLRDDRVRGAAVFAGSGATMVLAVALAVQWLKGGGTLLEVEAPMSETLLGNGVLLCELLLMVLVVYLCVKHRKYPIAALSVVQTLSAVWLEQLSGVQLEEGHPFLIDRLSMLMVLMVAVVGGLIVIYAVGYMRGYHAHHTEFADRRGFFFPLLFVFLGAMFGLILSDRLTLMYFFWEITSVCSFLLIGYTRTAEAIHNSFRALWMNLLGGLGFAAALVVFGVSSHNLSLRVLVSTMIYSDSGVALICVGLLAFAALTKSAQLPFSQWLLGAMVAPTPTSALLHSATMVKAGVYLLIRLAPAMRGNLAGTMVAMVGGLTFFMASLMAISQSDGKKVLAYSTISNLGLITACAGVGAPEAVWAGVFLILFHAVSKSMLFQSVGAVENATHSRDVESMQGLLLRLPKLAWVMIVGICAMFLAPFGMLISKWAALRAFMEADALMGTVLVLFVCFGSATTLLYWAKWLTRLVALNGAKPQKDITERGQYLSLFAHLAMVVGLCAAFPKLSGSVVQPIVYTMYGEISAAIESGDMAIMGMLLLWVLVIPLLLYRLSKGQQGRTAMTYMAGINAGDSRHFIGSMGEQREVQLSAWYLENWFGEDKLMKPSLILASVHLVVSLIGIVLLGGVLS